MSAGELALCNPVLDALAAAGWTVRADLNVPHATLGRVRFWFRRPTVYYTVDRHLMPFARSTLLDTARVSADELLARARALDSARR